MAFLSNLLIAQPTGLWPSIINIFGNVGNYAWAIILLTIAIKVIMSPLDFFNKKISRKNAKMQTVLQPEMAKIQKQYGHDKNLYNQKLSELYKNNNFNMMGSCIFMLVNLVLTLVIFLTLFGALNNMANFKIQNQYEELKTAYYSVYEVDLNNTKQAEEAVKIKYDEIKDSWLWIDNIWRAETPWTNSVPTFEEYLAMIGNKVETIPEGKTEAELIEFSKLSEAEQTKLKDEYTAVMGALRESEGKANGYLILAVLAVGTALLSQFLMQRKMKVVEGQKSNKFMMFFLPILMGVFTLFYNSVFALYIIVGQVFAIVTTPLIDLILDKLEMREKRKKDETIIVEYSRKKK